MIRPEDETVVQIHKEKSITMKKLMTIMLGLSLALGAVSVSFADDAPPKEGKKKGKKGKKDETKKEVTR